jgi:hypothetical protein
VPSVRSAALAGSLRSAVTAWLAALGPSQRAGAQDAAAGSDGPELREWTYLPGPRPGLALGEMDPPQQDLAMAVVDTACSAAGARAVREVMQLERVLRALEEAQGRPGAARRDPGRYWWRVLGDPAAEAPWLVRVSGHHVVVHARVHGDHVSGTPSFLGANPARVPVRLPGGPPVGARALPAEQLLGSALLAALDDGQRALAVVSPHPPDDIATRRDPVADAAAVPRGVRYDQLDADQASRLELLVRRHLGRLHPDLAASAWRALVDEGLAGVAFAWQGPLPGSGPVLGGPYYYAVRAESFLLEHDCAQGGGNHVHDVWRDVRSDWGDDVLASHHRAEHRGHPDGLGARRARW